MQTLTFPSLKTSDVEGNPAFNVVIAYEDFETGKRAMKTYEYLVEHLGGECTFNHQMWKFDVLAVPKLREMAVKDASSADIILVSAHGSSEVPPEVKMWIESWLDEDCNAIALVGLFDNDAYVENPVGSYLADVAKRGKLEFFSQPGAWPFAPKQSVETGPRNDKAFSVLADVVRQDVEVSHWGINE